MSTCKGKTATGKACTASAKHGDFCGRHAGAAARSATAEASAAVRAAEQERLFAKAASEMRKATEHLKAASAHLDYPEITRNLKILGLNATTRNAATIKKAFRGLAMALHPDTSGLKDEKARRAAEEQFKIVREAFVTLRTKLGL